VRQNRATTGGIVSAGRYHVNVGRRWGGLRMTVIRDGDHIAIYTGNQLIRALDANTHSTYQPIDPAHRYQKAPR
jgi:hypothetical protein